MTYPLEDITVLDLIQIYNSPYATYLMALGGARVIKVEPPSNAMRPGLAGRIHKGELS
ncbi:CoA transferase [Xanthobacter oligotrophicus]|uniref:CoA transferase n=1 Tax=Xanthobacter oligotrophicus TaxID=2607286 RepID=UPI001AEEDB5C|nr:CoA transferase [Xanthobacter oligotrophicus]MCG5236593.1 CoA transferase [Xanthobacter oligotrophicus]